MRARLATLILAAGVSLGGCAYGGTMGGLSVGTGYGPYGYGYGNPYAYGAGYGYDAYSSRWNPYYRPPYYGSPYYGSPYMGWYDGYYYPGTGYYVYDRDRNRRRINEAERRRWMGGIAEALATTARGGQTATSGSTTSAPRTVRTIRRTDDSTRTRVFTRDRDGTRSRTTSRSSTRSSNDRPIFVRQDRD